MVDNFDFNFNVFLSLITAQIHSFCFSNDSRYLAAVTRRGTTHVFPINPYGGAATVRTHCNPRVTNQRSLFQISAGMDQLVIRNQPRLPPFPNPTVVQPVVQIKQVFGYCFDAVQTAYAKNLNKGAILGLLPPGIAIETNEDTADAVFGYNKTAVAFGRDIITQNSRNVLRKNISHNFEGSNLKSFKYLSELYLRVKSFYNANKKSTKPRVLIRI